MAVITPNTALPEQEPVYRRNFFYFLLDSIFFTIAMGVIGGQTVIPDFVRKLTSSEILIGLSGTMFEIFWALPQLFIARYMVRFANKKWWFIGPNIPIRFVMLIFAAVTVWLGAGRPGAILAAFFICYGIAAFGDGLVGIPWADLTGTSLDGRWRARLFGISTAISGVILLFAAEWIRQVLGPSGPGFPVDYALIFGAAGILFAVSTLPVIFVRELPGGKAAEILSIRDFLPHLGEVLRADHTFRWMIIARMLMALFGMASPFYVGFATQQLGVASSVVVPNLVTTSTIGMVVGALIYSWLGAKDNLLFMRLALIGAALIPISGLLASFVGPAPLYFAFFVSGATMGNLFLCLQNWVVTHATHDQRPVYTGLFNTLGAGFSLSSPIIGGTIAQEFGYLTVFAVSLVMIIAAIFITFRFVRK